MNRTRLSLAAAVLALGAATLVPGGASSAAGAATCQGRPATVVGAPGQPVAGTPGPDVIVATDPTTVDAGDGDDVVCVTSPADDHLETVRLGAGADSLEIDGFAARVSDGDLDDVALGRTPSTDIITATQGAHVEVGAPGHVDTDDVTIGPGDTDLTVHGLPAGRYQASAGRNSFPQARLDDDGDHAWAIDGAAGTLSVDGGAPVVWSGFRQLRLSHLVWSRLSVRGTPGFDDVSAQGSRPRGPVDLDLGAGSDLVDLDASLTGSVVGGNGRQDQLNLTVTTKHSDLRLRSTHGWRVQGVRTARRTPGSAGSRP